MRGYTVSSVDTCLARLGGGGWSRSKQCTTKRRCVSSLSYITTTIPGQTRGVRRPFKVRGKGHRGIEGDGGGIRTVT
jgi:hypothetical protein